MRPNVSRSSAAAKNASINLGAGRRANSQGKPQARTGLRRLLLETLEQRQMMAGDVELLSTGSDTSASAQASTPQATTTSELIGQPEGEPAQDLVAFAKALDAAGVQFFGAEWCPFCTEQKQLFQDGGEFLPFIEVTGPDRQLNSIGVSEGIQTFPTWEFPDGTRLTGVQSLQTLSQRSGVSIPTSETPSFATIGSQTVLTGSPLHIPVDAYDPNGGPLTVTVSVDNPALLDAIVLSGNRSIRIDMNGFGDMVFELFEDRAPTASGRVVELANSNFYDGIIFHRVVNGFVIQAGDPTGTGTSGSTLGNFDDDFDTDLQHNRGGVLSFAKTSDDTNNSQFFITETPTRHLDFNHSIFGQLVEGEKVREAISNMAVDGSGKPTTAITINSVDVFNDIENSVIMLKAKSNATGTTNVRVTVTNSTGQTFSEVVPVTVASDTVNSQPFLNPIATPAVTPVNTPATLQLSSVDVEGDAVTYTAVVNGSSGATASVNASTGLVTVTPTSNFVGTVSVLVGVRPGPGVTGNAASDADTQSVNFRFEGEQTGVATPTGVDLIAASDTGSSSTDNITNSGSLTFTVSGVTSGATVELVRSDTGVVLGTGVASGTTVNVTTNNIAALGDGTYSIAARQRVNGVTSSLSPAMQLIYDRTNPASVVGSVSTLANVSRAYVADLVSSEEGNGLVYSLTAMPTGAAINSSTGVINWTPTATQTGANTFTVELTDRAGNVRTESFTVTVGAIPTAEIELQITDLQGNPISNVNVGDEFLLQMFGIDARGGFNRRGIFAAAADILFDSTLVQPVASTPIQYGPGFTTQRGGVFSTGLIDELGAAKTDTVPSGDRESLVATVRMRALAAGNVNIRSEPAEAVNSEVLLYLVDNQIAAEDVGYNSVSLAIGQNFTTAPDSVTVAEDSAATTINVLANDTNTSGSGTLTVTAVTQPTVGGSVTQSGNQVQFTPAANFNGTAVFTYTASLAGANQTNSVTVTVTPVNDPPTGTADTFTVDQDTASTELDVLANDSSAPDEGETLRITRVVNSSAGSTISVNAAGNRVNYQPAAGFTGSDTFTYTLSDGSLTRDVQVTVTVRSTDPPPTAVNDTATVIEDASEVLINVTSNDTRDAANQAFTIVAVGTPSQGGTARANTDGSQIFYAPAANFSGTETVAYTIRDSGGGSAIGTVTFTVTAVNDAPPTTSPTKNVFRAGGETLLLSVSDLPTNVDSGETLRFTTASTSPNGATVRVSTDGSQIFYTPVASTTNGNSTDTITFTVGDGSTLTSTGTITVNINDFNQVDIMVNFDQSADMFGAFAFRLEGTDALGASVSKQLQVVDGNAMFDNVLPGEYNVSIPAIPFLQNGDTPQSIPLSVPTTVDATSAQGLSVTPNLGPLRAKYVSMSDWFGSAPRKSILASVAPGQSSAFAQVSAATDTIFSPSLQLDASGSNLTITGKNSSGADISASVPAVNDPRVQVRAQVGDMRLIRISVESDDVTFNPTNGGSTSTASAQGSNSAVMSSLAEGEQLSSQSNMAMQLTETSSDVGASELLLGSQLSSPASVASTSITQADVFVPEVVSSPSRALASGFTSDLSENVDAAMDDLLPSLTLQSTAADQVAESQTRLDHLDSESIDAVLRSEI